VLTLSLLGDEPGTRDAIKQRLSRSGRGGSTTAVATTVAPGSVPVTIVGVATITGTADDTIRVEASVLVERDEVSGVGGTEYIATATTVMTACHQGEACVAFRHVALGG
jgi:hypothetical protein